MPRIRLYMAPMKGFTDYIFRSAFADHFGGFDMAVAPFIVSKQDRRIKRKYVKDVLPENNTRMPVVPQILSKTPADFTFLANYLYDLGYDTVNWNLGCPFPMVANKQRGAGMLPHQGPVDLDAFEDCLAVTRHPVVYNGDIRTVDDFRRLSRRFDRVYRWMIGRWCLADPFLPGRITTGADDIPDKVYRMQRFHEDLFEAYSCLLDGPSHVLGKMKGFWQYFSLPFEDCKKAMKEIRKTRRPDQYLEQVNLFFESQAQLRRLQANLSA